MNLCVRNAHIVHALLYLYCILGQCMKSVHLNLKIHTNVVRHITYLNIISMIYIAYYYYSCILYIISYNVYTHYDTTNINYPLYIMVLIIYSK